MFLQIATAVLVATTVITRPVLPRAQQSYSSIVVFGDSYTDNGNAYRLSNKTWPADPAYYEGRFSNGPTWAENLAQNLSIPLHNYACGGATTSNALVQGYSGNSGTLPVPAVDDQAAEYLKAPPEDAPIDSTLFALLGGANDILLYPNITAIQSAGELSVVVTKMRNAGAKSFLFLNYPDLSTIPYDSYIPLAMQLQLRDYSQQLGAGLLSLAEGLSSSSASPTSPTNAPTVSATVVDLVPLFGTFGFYKGGWKTAGFDTYGLYGSCLVGAYVEVPQRTLCDDPDRHVWWDEYHPTRHAHQIIAQAAMKALFTG